MKEKLLSICCLGYNHASFIEENINAILSSKYSSIEIIAVDDGSTDGSQEILRRVAETSRYPVKLILQENTGCSAKNLNRAIKQAAGEFITFISLDDVLNMPEIDKELVLMNESPNLAFVASTNFAIIDAAGEVSENRKLPIYRKTDSTIDEMLEFEYSRFESFWLQGTVFKREVIDAVKGFDDDMLADDIVLRTKVLRFMQGHKGYSFVLTDQKTFFYRLHGNNISGNIIRQVRSVSEYLDRYWPSRPNPKVFNDWLSYANKNSDIPSIESLWIQDERLVQSLNDENVLYSVIEKLRPAVRAFHRKHVLSKLYFDSGNGFSEENSLHAYHGCTAVECVEFQFPEGHANIKAIRFDPAEESGGIELKSVEIIRKDGSKTKLSLDDVESNCNAKIGDVYVFNTCESELVFSRVNFSGVSSINIKFQWIANDGLMSLFEKEIDSIYNSYSWKLSKPVRIAGKILRKIFPEEQGRLSRTITENGAK